MALSLSTTLLPFRQDVFIRSDTAFSGKLRRQNSLLTLSSSKFIDFPSKLHPTTTIPRVVSKENDSSTSTIADLDKQQETKYKEQPEQSEIAQVWRAIHGQDNWAGLLDPLDPLLRSEIIRYGELTQACYDSFDYDLFSKYCGSCRFPRRRFFESLDMSHPGYDVTRYLYATGNISLPSFFKRSRWPNAWSEKSNWMGYVSVSKDETSKRLGRRDIVICWRGTVTRMEWLSDMMDILKPVSDYKIPCPDPAVQAEYGFMDLYTDKHPSCRFGKYSAREQILTEITKLINKYADEEVSITVTGHSLGSALATLSAYDIAETGLHLKPDGRASSICVFSFAGPRVGNTKFKERLEKLGVKVLRIVNVHDVVPKSPGMILNEKLPSFLKKFAGGTPWFYSHVGVELQLDHKVSPYLQDSDDVGNAHNLEAYLHLLDGFHGKDRKFELTTGRDPALVNKSADFLKDNYLVPPCWKQYENKGLRRDGSGRYILPERPKIVDDHPDDMSHHMEKLGLHKN